MKKICIISIFFLFIFLNACASKDIYGEDVTSKQQETINKIELLFNKLDSDFFSEDDWSFFEKNINKHIERIKECQNIEEIDHLFFVINEELNRKIIIQSLFSKIEEYSNGSGTKDDPYIINNAAQLLKLSKDAYCEKTEGIYYMLGENINMNGWRWVPIGYNYDGKLFKGNFNGNGYVVSNISFNQINYEGFNDLGLFGYNKGDIKNVGLVNFNVDIKWNSVIGYNLTVNTGGIAGLNEGVINNCYVIGNINLEYFGDLGGHKSPNHVNAGGIVGINFAKGIISNCYSDMNINVSYSNEQGTVNIGGISLGKGIVSNSLSVCDLRINVDSYVNDYYSEKYEISPEAFNCYAYDNESREDQLHCTEEDLNNKDFYYDVLGWNNEVWNCDNIIFQNNIFVDNHWPTIINDEQKG